MDEVTRRSVVAVPILVVRREVPAAEVAAGIPALIMPMFDRVYAGLPRGGLGGDNVVSYRPGPGSWTIEVGVTVPAGADPGPVDGLVHSELPAGEVATTLHRGPYDRLGEAHGRVQRWCTDHGAHPPAAHYWEIYGDWREDPAELETEVQYRLADDLTATRP
jgi:hypothetical protein